MTRDARMNGRCDSVIIFEIMTIFCTKIQVKSLINYVVQIGWPPYWKFTVIKNFYFKLSEFLLQGVGSPKLEDR